MLRSRLTQNMVRIAALGAATAVLVFCALVFGKYVDATARAADRLQQAQLAIPRTEQALRDMKASREVLARLLPQPLKTPDTLLMHALDDIKRRMPTAEIAVTAVETRSGERVVPVTITGAITDYSRFVNDVCMVERIAPAGILHQYHHIGSETDKKAVLPFTIAGLLRIPEVLRAGSHHREGRSNGDREQSIAFFCFSVPFRQ